MDATKVNVVVGVRTEGVADLLARVIERDGNGRVIATAPHPVATADVVRRLSPDVVVVESPDHSDTSIVGFLRSFVPQDQLIVLHGSAEEGAADDRDACVRLSLEDLEVADALKIFPAALSTAYVAALRDRRRRDITTIEALAAMAEVREASSPSSVGRAADLAMTCLEQIDPALVSCDDVRAGFLLHDVGKIAIPETILKKRSRLDAQEWSLMEKHPELGVEIVKPLELGPLTLDVIRHHHERWDGSGYPGRLVGEEIPLPARVFSVADAYESMTSNRPYRAAMSHADALQIIKVNAGQAFDGEVVDVLLSVSSDQFEFPPQEIDLTG